MKKSNKILSLAFSGICLIYILILLYPQFLFANNLAYKSFCVYYDSNEISSEELELIIDKSEQLLMRSDLHMTGIKQDVFICSGFGQYTFFALLSRKTFAVNYPIIQNIFLSKSSVSKDLIYRNGEDNNERSLSGVIAHETTHSLLENKLGIIKYKLLPSWKNEGYCDYVANESSFNEQIGLQDMCNNKDYSEAPSFRYFKYRLIAKYLFEDENASMDEFLNNDFDLKEMDEKLKVKYCTS